jgi:uncharacterized OB-fold protein
MSVPAPAIEGWFTLDPAAPRLLGSRCDVCGTTSFPPGRSFCPNPSCDGAELETVELSRTGRLWSWTVNHYAPPPPYVSPDPFEPYGVAAVELSEERIVVLGQLASGVDVEALEIGAEMELALGSLPSEDGGSLAIWNWRPVGTP